MSRAFTRHDQLGEGLADVGERPVSPHRNLVTPAGLEQIEREIARLRDELARTEAGGDRARAATLSRDLRYWAARRETAEVSVPDPQSDVVRFGMTVQLEGEDGRQARWTIVGEDEADAAHGTVSHVSPLARALFGKGVGETAMVAGKDWEIVDVSRIELPPSSSREL